MFGLPIRLLSAVMLARQAIVQIDLVKLLQSG